MKRRRPRQHYRSIKTKKGRKKILINKGIKRKKNYGSLFHGTSEQALAKMPLTGGLKPNKGKIYLTDSPNYARFQARQAVEGTKFKPVVIEVDKPTNFKREGRHFTTTKSIPSRRFKKVNIEK